MTTAQPMTLMNRTAVSFALLLVSLVAVRGAVFEWNAVCGCFPDLLMSGVSLYNDAPTSPPPQIVPVLQDGAMTITNSVPSQHIDYYLSGTNLSMPPTLIIEAQVRVLTNYDTSGGKRTASAIQFTTSTNVGNILWLDVGRIFTSNGDYTRDPNHTVSLDTTEAIHTYRIETDGVTAGSTFRVFADGMLVITSLLYRGTTDHPSPIIWFGDGTYYASGGAQWYSFRHNAAAAASTIYPQLCISSPRTLTLWGLPGKKYAIESVESLDQTSWAWVANVSLATNVYESVHLPSATSANAFYRARQLP